VQPSPPFPRIPLLGALLALGGCCQFMPCHPGTHITGDVTDAVSGQPIADAVVRLYHHETRTGTSGCFSLGGADALPFEFAVSAPGYKPLREKAIPGTFRKTVILMPVDGNGESRSRNHEVSRDQDADLSNCTKSRQPT